MTHQPINGKQKDAIIKEILIRWDPINEKERNEVIKEVLETLKQDVNKDGEYDHRITFRVDFWHGTAWLTKTNKIQKNKLWIETYCGNKR
jgi:hypothetical protein